MRSKKKARRIQMLVLGGVLLTAAGTAFGFLARDSISFYKTPTEVLASDYWPAQLIRLGGMVVAGSRSKEGATHIFELTDLDGGVAQVAFTGVLPDLFEEGELAVAEGYWQEGRFEAHEVLAKHDENYVPKEFADAVGEGAGPHRTGQ